MNISTSFTTLQPAQRNLPRPTSKSAEESAESQDKVSFTSWLNSDTPVDPRKLAQVGGGVGAAGLVSLAAGLATQQPGLILGGMMASMVGFTVGYAALQA